MSSRQNTLQSSARTRAGISQTSLNQFAGDLNAAMNTLATPAGQTAGRMIAKTGAQTASVAFNQLLASGI